MRSTHASGSLPAAPAPPGRRGDTTTISNAQLGLKLAVERGAYVAGQQVKGVLELSVKGHLALGEVGIEFLGVEGALSSLSVRVRAAQTGYGECWTRLGSALGPVRVRRRRLSRLVARQSTRPAAPRWAACAAVSGP